MNRHTDFQEELPNSHLYFDGENEETTMKPNIWQRLSRVTEGIIYVFCFLAVAKMVWPEVERQEELNVEMAKLDIVLEERREHVGQLRQEHELLKNDREFLETVSRDRLNLMRDGEYVIRIERGEEAIAN